MISILTSPEIPLTHTICKNSIPGEMGMNIDKDHVRRRIRQTLKDKEIDRPGNLTRDTCQIWENLHNVGRTMEPKSVWILIWIFEKTFSFLYRLFLMRSTGKFDSSYLPDLRGENLHNIPYARHYNPLLIWNCSRL